MAERDDLNIDDIVNVSIEEGGKFRWKKGQIKKIYEDSVDVILEGKKTPKKFDKSDVTTVLDSKISYDPTDDFASFYKDIYDPISNMIHMNIQKDIHMGFNIFLNKYENYSFLRSLSLETCLVGDMVILAESSKEVRIVDINEEDNKFKISINNQIEIDVDVSNLKPIDTRINQMKKDDLNMMYSFIRNKVKSIYFTEFDFFFSFLDFFKPNFLVLLSSINTSHRRDIFFELKEKYPRLDHEKFEKYINKNL